MMKLINWKNMRKNKALGFYLNYIMVLFVVLSMAMFVNAKNGTTKVFHSIEDIHNTAKKFLEQHTHADPTDTEISLGKIDPRIKFIQCEKKLEAFFPQNTKKIGKITIGISCNGTIKWKLFIAARIERYENVWITKRSLSKSDTINLEDLVQQRVRVNSLRKSPMKNTQLIENTTPKRRIPAGSIIYESAICMVCSGDKVNVLANNSLINISIKGIALADAKLGESVKIRNTQSKRIFTAIVIGKHQLNVKLAKI